MAKPRKLNGWLVRYRAKKWLRRRRHDIHEYLTHPIWRWKYRKLIRPGSPFYEGIKKDLYEKLMEEEDRQILRSEGQVLGGIQTEVTDGAVPSPEGGS